MQHISFICIPHSQAPSNKLGVCTLHMWLPNWCIYMNVKPLSVKPLCVHDTVKPSPTPRLYHPSVSMHHLQWGGGIISILHFSLNGLHASLLCPYETTWKLQVTIKVLESVQSGFTGLTTDLTGLSCHNISHILVSHASFAV